MARCWTKRIGVVALVLLYLGMRAANARFARTTDTDLETFFLPSAKIALAGHPLHIYEIRHNEYPNANGPMAMVPLTIVAALAKELGMLDDRMSFRVLAVVVFAIFPLLLSREAMRTVDLLRSTQLRGVRRLLAYGILILGPEAAMTRGHMEQPLMLFLLLWSVRSIMLGRHARAGVLLGAALLTRTSALLYLPPLALLLVADRKWREALRFTGCALLTLIVGLLPFAVADRENLVYSLFTSHRVLRSLGGSLWEIVPGSALSAIGNRYDSTIALGASVLFSLVLLARLPGLRLGSGSAYALLAICGLCLPFLMKSVWAYYFVDAYVLLALFWLSGARPLDGPRAVRQWRVGAALPLSALLASVLAAYIVRSHDRTWTPGWSLTVTVTTVAVIALVAGWLYDQDRQTAAVGGVRSGKGVPG